MNDWVWLAIWAVVMMVVLKSVLWMVARKVDNYALVDVAWSYGFVLVALLFLLLTRNYNLRVLVMAGMIAVWSFRLGTYLYLRTVGKPEEGRYREMRRAWRTGLGLKFYGFYQAQALSVVLLSTPFLLVVISPIPYLAIPEFAALILAAVSIAGESLADRQLHRFLADPNNRGKVCRKGLWRYSRHPNYFFESLIWLAFALYAVRSDYGFLAFLCPLTMWYLILKVTGIPPTEAQSLRSKGEAYRTYQRETSAFFPLPPKLEKKPS